MFGHLFWFANRCGLWNKTSLQRLKVKKIDIPLLPTELKNNFTALLPKSIHNSSFLPLNWFLFLELSLSRFQISLLITGYCIKFSPVAEARQEDPSYSLWDVSQFQWGPSELKFKKWKKIPCPVFIFIFKNSSLERHATHVLKNSLEGSFS